MFNLNGINSLEDYLVASRYKTSLTTSEHKDENDNKTGVLEYTISIGEEKSTKRVILARVGLILHIPLMLITSIAFHALNATKYLLLGVFTLDGHFFKLFLKELGGAVIETFALPIIGVVSIVSPKQGLKSCGTIKNLFDFKDLQPIRYTPAQVVINLIFETLISPVAFSLRSVNQFAFAATILDPTAAKYGLFYLAVAIIGPIGNAALVYRNGFDKGQCQGINYTTNSEKSSIAIEVLEDDDHSEASLSSSAESPRSSNRRNETVSNIPPPILSDLEDTN